MRNLKKILSVLLVVAMLVASMVPAFAADTFTYSAQAKALYDLKLFNGVSATEYAPDLGSSLTREQGFKIILSLLGKADAAKALTAADVDAALVAFGDVKDVEPTLKNYVALAVKLGLVKGDGKNLDAKGVMLGKDFATVLLRQLGYADTEFAYDTAAADLAAKGGLTTAEATKFNTKALIRDDLVGMAYGSLQAKYKTSGTVIAKLIADKVVDEAAAVAAGVYTKPVAASSVTATITGAKTFTLAFNAAVDATKAAVTVKSGVNTLNVAKVTPSADNKTLTVELASKFAAGDYSISVAGLSDAALTAKVTAVAEKVAKIVFPSDAAVMSSATADAHADVNGLATVTKVSTQLKIYNQYNEDVTSAYASSLTFQDSGTTVDSDGIVTIIGGVYTLNNKLVVVAMYNDSTNSVFVSQSATLTISDKVQIGSISASSVYNADGKTITSAFNANEFFLVVDFKDQYGKAIKDTALLGSLISNIYSQNTTVIGTFPTVSSSSFQTKTINGETKVVLALPVPTGTRYGGKVTVTIVSSRGVVGSYEIDVKEAAKVDTLTFTAPTVVPVGEDVLIPYTAVDQFGTSITDYTTLSAVLPSSNAYWKQNYVTGKAELYLVSQANKGTVVVTATTPSTILSPAKVATITLNVTAAATPAVVSGFTSDVKTNILDDGGSTGLGKTYIKLKDQYGRDMDMNRWMTSTTTTNPADTGLTGVDATTGLITEATDAYASYAGTDMNQYRFVLTTSDKTIVAPRVVTQKIVTVRPASGSNVVTTTNVGDMNLTVAPVKNITIPTDKNPDGTNVGAGTYTTYAIANIAANVNADTTLATKTTAPAYDTYTWDVAGGTYPTLYPVGKGSATLTLKLQKRNTDTGAWQEVSGSAYSWTESVVSKADIDTYAVTDLVKMYYDTNAYFAQSAAIPTTGQSNKTDSHMQTISVTGTLKNGTTVSIPFKNLAGTEYAHYAVTTTTYGFAVDSQDGGARIIVGKAGATSVVDDAYQADVKASFDANTTVKTTNIVVNVFTANGAVTIIKPVEYSTVAPEVATLALRADNDLRLPDNGSTGRAYDPATGAKVTSIDSYRKNSDTAASISFADFTALNGADNHADVVAFANRAVKFTDQYGKAMVASSAGTSSTLAQYAFTSSNVIVSAIKNEKGETTDAAKNAYTEANLAAGYSFTVTAIASNGKIITFQVVLK